jgi:hypothetical protein
VKVTGTLLSSQRTNSVLFRLDILDPCKDSVITASVIPDVVYLIGQGVMSVTFPKWTESLGLCSPFTYSASIDPLPPVSPFTF